MVQSLVDPCLYYWKNLSLEVTLMAVIHVDNVILMGMKNTIEKFKRKLQKRFNILPSIGFGEVEETLRCVV